MAARLREEHAGLVVELVEIRTQGDRDRNSPLSAIGGQGLFTKEIQRALLGGLVDVAVHSLKDLPTPKVPGLILGAIPPREAVSDALIAPRDRLLELLPAGARVGTSSLRRRAQLLHLRPDLQIENVRGNVETRLNAALGGPLDAVVLAQAGLARLKLDRHITERLGPPAFLPAVGQGALGIECRENDELVRGYLSPLDDPTTRASVLAERALLERLEGGCVVPIAAWGRVEDDGATLTLDAAVFDPDGRQRIAAHRQGRISEAEALGRAAAVELLEAGAGDLLGRPRGTAGGGGPT